MPPKTYRQLCGVARALDLVGERWTLLLIRDLLPGPQSYSALLDGLPGLTTNLLAKRLKALQAAGLVQPIEVDASATGGAVRGLYGLTEAGEALAPVVAALSEWGAKHGAEPTPDATLNHRWFLILLARHYTKTERRWLVQVNTGEREFQFRLGTQEFESVEGCPWKADLIIQASPAALHALLFTVEDPNELLRSGQIKLEGAAPKLTEAWDDFLAAFGLDE